MIDTARRSLFRAGTAAGLVLAGWRLAFAAESVMGPSPYGPLGAPDANGVRLPAGFSARLVARTGQPVSGTRYVWHGQPDGGATFATPDGGWIYVSNSELNGTAGGVGAIRFDRTGRIADAYRILSGTTFNCAGGATPWGTWLSCEEFGHGRVWECDPTRPGQGIDRPAMGLFRHEAAAVDPRTGFVYLTEDDEKSRFYRFRPSRNRDLSAGVLEAAAVTDGRVNWIAVPPTGPYRGRDAFVFNRGEGAFFSRGFVFFSTTGDHRVWALETASDRLDILYDAGRMGSGAPLSDPDNITVHEPSGDIFVAEDAGNLELVLLASGAGERIAAPFLQLVGHDGSEITGPAFTPRGDRLYVTSQRGIGGSAGSPGMTFEIRGPFRRT